MTKLVLFALDESLYSIGALNWAFQYILREGDKLTVVVVIDKDSERDATISRTKTLLRAVWQTTSLTVTMSIRVLSGGKPGPLICQLVDEISPSILVLGSSGKTSAAGIFVGSVSNYCIANARTSVIVTRLSEEDYERGRGLGTGERRRSKSPFVDVLSSTKLLS